MCPLILDELLECLRYIACLINSATLSSYYLGSVFIEAAILECSKSSIESLRI